MENKREGGVEIAWTKGLATRQTVGIWLRENGSFCGKLAIFVANACFLRHSHRTFCLIFLTLAPRSFTPPTPPPTPTRARGTFWRHSGSAAAHRPGPLDHVTQLEPISSGRKVRNGGKLGFWGKHPVFEANTRFLRKTLAFWGKRSFFQRRFPLFLESPTPC